MSLPKFSNQADNGIHAAALQLLIPALTQDSRILVLGAGQGAFEYQLQRAGIAASQIVAADINPTQHRVDSVPCVKCDLNDAIPAEDSSFDVVVATEVIEHLQNPQRLLDESHRVLRPSGSLLLTTPNVHSLVQKIRYLFTDQFDYFAESDFSGSGHLHPIFEWWLSRVTRGHFFLEAYTSYSFHLRLIPGLPAIPMPFRHRLFSPSNIYRMRKLSSAA